MELFLIRYILIFASLLIVSTNARIARRNIEESCPVSSSGEYPNCECANGSKFNQIHNVCPPQALESLAGSCPNDASGVFPNCACKLGKVYDHQHSICLEIDRTKCPARSVGTIPNCKCEEGYKLDNIHWYCRAWYLNDTREVIVAVPHHHCPLFHNWDGKRCEPIRCPNNPEHFYPHCTDTHVDHHVYVAVCPPGQNVTIDKPFCHCPDNLDYTYPICHEPCEYQTYYDLKTHTCIKRPCPAGWIGDYYPNCIVRTFQTCPPEFPGEWPNCNIYDEGPRHHDRLRNEV